MNIYLVIAGEYSDRRVFGAFTNKRKADVFLNEIRTSGLSEDMRESAMIDTWLANDTVDLFAH
jgi:hypothetical protein